MNTDIVVIGAGGHAKVCIELLRAQGDVVAFCIGSSDSSDTCVGVPVLKSDDHLATLRKEGYWRVFVALGSNALRNRLAKSAIDLGFVLVNALSPSAVISPSAKIGNGVAVMAGAVINAEAIISDLCIINTGATIDHDCQIGLAAHIAPQSALAGNVEIGKESFVGIGTKIIPTIRVGECVMIGAGSVVISDVNSRTTVVGVPAKVINNI
ncbi:acetyltransferase [Pseudomonas fluorescens]|uniref:Acetyltransferase EpsM n=1 Tax=Pseudomonas fluorescens TaxID=294 RepID=A0A5E7LEA3_PSEFL|nr:acetyltransferase [Pseudomonas fluorescens]VVP12550.1 Putative acetyltransferase EpsM [Pseudomonas fluorescens]